MSKHILYIEPKGDTVNNDICMHSQVLKVEISLSLLEYICLFEIM